jgi:hypothetical protein
MFVCYCVAFLQLVTIVRFKCSPLNLKKEKFQKNEKFLKSLTKPEINISILGLAIDDVRNKQL